MYGNLPNPYISDVKLFLNKNHKKMKITEFGVQELNQEEMKKVDGGFFPLVILGIKISAEIVAATFLTGFGAGITIAATKCE